MASASERNELWTPANLVTLARILLIPVFVIAVISPWPEWFPQWRDAEAWKPIVSAAVFIIISSTDAIDGYLARSRDEVTTLGKFMDPLADKILIAAALLALIELGVLPSWVALIILAREFIVSGIRMVAASNGVVIAASMWGKVKTVTQIIAVVLFLVKDSHMIGDFSSVASDGLYLFSWAMMFIALFFTIVSMLDYFSKARELLGFKAKGKTVEKASPGAPSEEVFEAFDGEVASIADDGLRELAQQVVDTAAEKGKTLATAESCTGGLISGMITAIPGSSAVTAGGIISYSNDMKHRVLGVSELTLKTRGAVSRQTACEMAAGVRSKLGVDVAVSVTGIAGPGGAVAGKPVGTVWIGLSDNEVIIARNFLFKGNREQVRRQTVKAALEMLLTELSGESLVAPLE